MREGIIVLSSSLIILHVDESDSGTYTCVARSSRGEEVQSTSQLTVTSSRDATQAEGTELVQEGVVILPCRVKSPSLVITCFDNGIFIRKGSFGKVLASDENIRLITDVASEQQETYNCETPGLELAHTDARALIAFRPKDIFVTKPSDASLFVGEDHLLSCSTKNPRLTVRWHKDGTLLLFNDRILKVNKHVLLRKIVESDAGVYTCLASDIRGHHVASIMAQVTILQHGLNGKECGTLKTQEGRIDGQHDERRVSAPWMALLYVRGRYLCSGSLIDRHWVVTAAHCFHGHPTPNIEHVSIRLGGAYNGLITEQSEIVAQTEEIYEHENFDPSTFDNDIALVKLVSPIRSYNDHIKPICLANDTKYRDLMTPGAIGRVTGWATSKKWGITAYHINEKNIPFVGFNTCKQHFRRNGLTFTKNMFCAKRPGDAVDACLSDGGGPYSIKDGTGRWYLTGIVSWGQRCDTAGQFSVYTRYSKYHMWIQNIVSGLG